MRLTFLPSRALTAWVGFAALTILLLVDGGAIMLTRMSTPERTRDAGHVAAHAVEHMTVTQRTAVVAYDAARAAARDDALQINTDDFRVLPDGRVRITGTRTAPTLVMHRLPLLRDYVSVTATETVEPLPYGSTP